MNDSRSYEMERQIAADVLTKAGQRAESLMKTAKAVRKSDDHGDVVTNVDKTVQEEVLGTLERIFPTYGHLAEEGEALRPGSGPARNEREFMWVLDPIDGTNNFAHGIPLYGLSLALLRKKQAVVGVIALPETEETYSAALGGKALRNAQELNVPVKRELGEAVVAMTWGKSPAQRTRMLAAMERIVPKVSDVLSVGSSAISLSWLASGKVDVVVDNGDLWDFAAGFMIAKQMGAVVTEWDGTRPTYKERDFYTLVTTHDTLHQALVALLAGI